MGLFDRLKGGKMEDPVRGSAEVVAVRQQAKDALVQNVTMDVVIYAEGVEPTRVTWRGMVKRHKFPRPGTALPATVDRANPEDIDIDWDEAPNVVESAISTITGSSELTPDQAIKAKSLQEAALANADEMAALVKRWQAGEITQEELLAQQTEILGQDPSA